MQELKYDSDGDCSAQIFNSLQCLFSKTFLINSMWMGICTLKPKTRLFLHFTETRHNGRVNIDRK